MEQDLQLKDSDDEPSDALKDVAIEALSAQIHTKPKDINENTKEGNCHKLESFDGEYQINESLINLVDSAIEFKDLHSSLAKLNVYISKREQMANSNMSELDKLQAEREKLKQVIAESNTKLHDIEKKEAKLLRNISDVDNGIILAQQAALNALYYDRVSGVTLDSIVKKERKETTKQRREIGNDILTDLENVTQTCHNTEYDKQPINNMVGEVFNKIKKMFDAKHIEHKAEIEKLDKISKDAVLLALDATNTLKAFNADKLKQTFSEKAVVVDKQVNKQVNKQVVDDVKSDSSSMSTRSFTEFKGDTKFDSDSDSSFHSERMASNEKIVESELKAKKTKQSKKDKKQKQKTAMEQTEADNLSDQSGIFSRRQMEEKENAVVIDSPDTSKVVVITYEDDQARKKLRKEAKKKAKALEETQAIKDGKIPEPKPDEIVNEVADKVTDQPDGKKKKGKKGKKGKSKKSKK